MHDPIGVDAGACSALVDERLARRTAASTPRDLFGDVDDRCWLWLLTEGRRRHDALRTLLPDLPPERIQTQFTGLAGDTALIAAFHTYRLISTLAQTYAARRVDAVLEFGCGWGRIIRFFLRDVAPDRLWGIDCFPEMIDLCRATNAWSRFACVDPWPPAALPSEAFDLVYAYSVFSHLSEAAHLAWLAELHRILRPGGLLVASTREREFILQCAAFREQQDGRDFVQGSRVSFPDTADALARYDRGDYVHHATGSIGVLDASFYGETCIPRAYVERVWTDRFTIAEYVEDRTRCDQNVIAAVRR